MYIDLKRIHVLVTIVSYCITMTLGVLYLFNAELKTLLFILLSLFISNILFCFTNLKYYMIHLIFYITIFVFLASRPTIDFIRTGSFPTYQEDAYRFAFFVMIITLLGLFIGGIMGRGLFKNWKQKLETPIVRETRERFTRKVRLVSLGVLGISYPFYVLRLVERVMYRRQTSYYEYYANFQSKLPYFTYILSAFMFYALCAYLATKPKKIYATLVLLAYIFANALHLLIGTRNPFILSLIFAFLYYYMRSHDGGSEKWIGRFEKTALAVGTPVLMLAMGALNYVRDGAKVTVGFVDLLIDFIYKQGTSFGVLARGYLYQSSLPIRELSNYTFGSIIDYFYRGSIGNQLFGTTPFEHTTNSIELALESNSYAHTISYIVMPRDYLDGHGIGDSYIMDIYTDYKYIGLLLFSIALGVLFVWLMALAYRKTVMGFTIVLMILGNLYFMPRSSFSESFFNLFTMQYWGIMLVIIIGAKLLTKPINSIIRSS